MEKRFVGANLLVGIVFFVTVLMTGCLSQFDQLMTEAKAEKEKGYLAKALTTYKKACEIEPQNTECRREIEKLRAFFRGVSAPGRSRPQIEPKPHRRPFRPSQQPEKHRSAQQIHIVKRGETLSDIAMRYYDTYKTEVYHVPKLNRYSTYGSIRTILQKGRAEKVGNVSDLLERINHIKAKNLYVGQKIVLPEIAGLDLYDRGEIYYSGKGKTKPQVPKSPHKEPEAPVIEYESEVVEPKPEPEVYKIPSVIRNGVDAYHNADFSEARRFFKQAIYDTAAETRKIALVYLALIEYAFGNLEETDNYLKNLVSIDAAFAPGDVRRLDPSLSGDVTPDIEKRYSLVKSE